MTTNGRCDTCSRHTVVTRYLDLFGEPVYVCADCTNEIDRDELVLDDTHPDVLTLQLFEEQEAVQEYDYGTCTARDFMEDDQ
jgi:DNA-directed RNA polymerase subunit RPC12/RpoP